MKKLQTPLYEVSMPPLKRDWYRCPTCGKKLVICDNMASCRGVFIICKQCKNEIEIKI